jgi:hypothetical protein
MASGNNRRSGAKGVRGRGSSSRSTNQDNITLELNIPTDLNEQMSPAFSSLIEKVNGILTNIKKHMDSQMLEMQNAFVANISEYEKKIKTLEKQVVKLEEDNCKLNEKIDFIEQEQLNNKLIMSGKEVHEAFANIPQEVPLHEASTWVAENILTEKCGLAANSFNIVEASRLGKKPTDGIDSRPIILTVDDAVSKREITNSIIKMKSKSLYINECLTKRRRDLYKKLLALRKTNPNMKMKLFTKMGLIHVKLNDSTRATKLYNSKDVESFISRLIPC